LFRLAEGLSTSISDLMENIGSVSHRDARATPSHTVSFPHQAVPRVDTSERAAL
jgi:hypothetical protein